MFPFLKSALFVSRSYEDKELYFSDSYDFFQTVKFFTEILFIMQERCF